MSKSDVNTPTDATIAIDAEARPFVFDMNGNRVDIDPDLLRRTPVKRNRPRAALSAELKAAVWDKTNGRCWYCGKQCNPFTDMHIDHKYPHSKGGPDTLGNLVIACVRCNLAKRDRSVLEYRRRFPWRPIHFFWGERQEQARWEYERQFEGSVPVTVMGEPA